MSLVSHELAVGFFTTCATWEEHIIKWLRSKSLTKPNIDKDVELQHLLVVTGGMQSGITTLEELAVP